MSLFTVCYLCGSPRLSWNTKLLAEALRTRGCRHRERSSTSSVWVGSKGALFPGEPGHAAELCAGDSPAHPAPSAPRSKPQPSRARRSGSQARHSPGGQDPQLAGEDLAQVPPVLTLNHAAFHVIKPVPGLAAHSPK